MRELIFEQVYLYGDNWEGKLKNIPEDALVYNSYNMTDKQQYWIIAFPIIGVHSEVDDKDDFYIEYGGAQVLIYDILDEYRFIMLKNVTPKEEWYDCGKERFDGIINPFLQTCYKYTYKTPKFTSQEWSNFLIINDEEKYVINPVFLDKTKDKLISVERLKSINFEGEIVTTTVHLYDFLNEKDYFCIIESSYPFNKLYDYGFMERENFKLTHNSSIFEEEFNKVVNYFKN